MLEILYPFFVLKILPIKGVLPSLEISVLPFVNIFFRVLLNNILMKLEKCRRYVLLFVDVDIDFGSRILNCDAFNFFYFYRK